MKKISIIIMVFIVSFTLSGCSKESNFIEGDLIESISFHKSSYHPDDEVRISIRVKPDIEHLEYEYLIEFFSIEELVDSERVPILDTEITYVWNSPQDDFRGYLLKVSLYHNDELVDVDVSGIDVSSDWTFNPRYGFLSSYSNLNENQVNEVLDNLNKYHINGLQFYDWQYKHHLPYDETKAKWYDIANNLVDADVIDLYISGAHERNMMAMNYNLIFGTYEDYIDDGVQLEWGLFKDTSHNTLDYHSLPSTWASSKLFLMDLNNVNWRQYILQKEIEVFQKFDFDGWHMDQLGDRGYTYNYNGSRVDLQNSYSSFISYMKQELDKDIVFNIVNNYGMLDVLPNDNLDFIYTELWDNHTYNELGNIIKLYRNISGKPVVVAAYMNYDLSNRFGEFNTPAILLTDAVIFSHGGTHIELGDHGMLGNEYFPNDNLKMSDELKSRLKEYYDFQVAYQNLLIDNINYTDNKVVIDDYEISDNGVSDSIWYHSTNTDDYQILHLINLLNNENDWRDNSGQKQTSEVLNNLKVKYYIDDDITDVYLASPDYQGGIAKEISFKIKSDKSGQYIEFEIDYLEYWDMIIMKK